jgi:3D (Asp-Asp-Asp) domain-containing protein
MRAPSVYIVLLGVVLGLVGDAVTQGQRAEARPFAPHFAVARQPQRAEVSRLPVKVTAYTQHRHVAASGRRVRRGVVALSPDLEQALGVEFGDRVVLEGVGIFVFEDRTAGRWRRRVDIFMESPKAARQFGVKATYVRAST